MFKDESIYQGIKEFETPVGRVRAVKDGLVQNIFVQIENAFVMVGTVSKKYRSPKSIYAAMDKCEMV